jgi:hypothetical protein
MFCDTDLHRPLGRRSGVSDVPEKPDCPITPAPEALPGNVKTLEPVEMVRVAVLRWCHALECR